MDIFSYCVQINLCDLTHVPSGSGTPFPPIPLPPSCSTRLLILPFHVLQERAERLPNGPQQRVLRVPQTFADARAEVPPRTAVAVPPCDFRDGHLLLLIRGDVVDSNLRRVGVRRCGWVYAGGLELAYRTHTHTHTTHCNMHI